MEQLTIDGRNVLAERGTAPRRSPMLFVHGYFATAEIFDHYLSYFAALGHPTYAVNLRGGERDGRTDDIGHVSMQDFIDDASTVARRLERPIVVGHSMGGLIAQKLAEAGLARAMILVSPAPPHGIPVITLELIRRQFRYLPALLASRPVVARFDDFCPLVLNRIPAHQQRSVFSRFVPDSGLAGREMLLGRIRVREKDVRCPVLVIGGDDDHFIPLRVVRRVAALYGATLHVAPGHGHLLPQEPGWEQVAERMARWLDEQGL